ncbi:hypothetical protein HKBW3S42_00166 [Candidatus Hakubella thermalkaliphila]|jgi:uncharacterized protein (DUF433 family)|uniref:Antitoxin n=2 Tax=Candidatus Hakubella thermalkaliphila TaxID=2754717 RepID=A0A6V8PIC4_9ACTN|nr:DUF433 domain-containing protein [Candidatus Hakubella thermalkaliphila]MBT9170044.1 hypothetical protein [Actinomycetota bacterium]GFP20898.1 hypothetical protein HKBW3S06_00125 [Candidatus Hakubella thermalkaliphila]GFP23052.1 hypothetical protein HKBW3S09_00519 [Candidatus Hakubella thermalkaliphila]GFP25915.1 hypothetical protein HKBW3S25_01399 [Candidatus Hakubella thermalkaliphila]GFP26997.1 hypothetical protein HKBW3S33_00410 [Candidatus Hakubella thermalkaliphila]
MLERISIDPEICHGKACIKGTRVPVHLILEMLAAGDSFADILESYPFLTEDDIRAAIAYASLLATEEIRTIPTVA